MHPEMIKALIRVGETTPAAIADELGVVPSAVSRVIHGSARSRRVAEHISKLVGKPLSELWPGGYDKHNPMRRSRSPGKSRSSASENR